MNLNNKVTLLGVFLIILSVVSYRLNIAEFIIGLLASVGITLIVLSNIEHLLLKKLFSRVTKNISESMQSHLSQTFDILSNSNYNGLVAILAPFRDESISKKTEKKRSDETIQTILQNIGNSEGEIFIMGISLLDFFSPGGKFYKFIGDIAKKGNNKLKFRVLLMNSDGYAIQLKSKLEGDFNEKGFEQRNLEIIRNITESIRGIERLNMTHTREILVRNMTLLYENGGKILNTECPNCGLPMFMYLNKEICPLEIDGIIFKAKKYGRSINENEIEKLISFALNNHLEAKQEQKCFKDRLFIDYKFYNFIPPARSIITQDALFVEQYFIAPRDEINDLIDDIIPCIAGRVPILQYSSSSNMHKAFQEQFKFIWGLDSKSIEMEEVKVTSEVFNPPNL